MPCEFLLDCMKKLDLKITKRNHKHLDMGRFYDALISRNQSPHRSLTNQSQSFRGKSPSILHHGNSSISLQNVSLPGADSAESSNPTGCSAIERKLEISRKEYFGIHLKLLEELPKFIKVSHEICDWSHFLLNQCENDFRQFITNRILPGDTDTNMESNLKALKGIFNKNLDALFPVYEEFILIKNTLRPSVPDYSSSLSP